jgi:hypothetical protein
MRGHLVPLLLYPQEVNPLYPFERKLYVIQGSLKIQIPCCCLESNHAFTVVKAAA